MMDKIYHFQFSLLSILCPNPLYSVAHVLGQKLTWFVKNNAHNHRGYSCSEIGLPQSEIFCCSRNNLSVMLMSIMPSSKYFSCSIILRWLGLDNGLLSSPLIWTYQFRMTLLKILHVKENLKEGKLALEHN